MLTSGPATGATLDHLTPTEGLILDVVVSRYALGHGFWSIATRHKKALDSLSAHGLITYDTAVTQGVYDVSPTRRALALSLTTLTSPALDPRCRSAYFGPKTNGFRVDCTRRAQHGGKHKGRFIADAPKVAWSTREAWGRDNEMYAESLARAATLWAEPDPCSEGLDYEPYGITVACDMPVGHDTRHLWPGDPERPWIKPVAWSTPFKRPTDWGRSR